MSCVRYPFAGRVAVAVLVGGVTCAFAHLAAQERFTFFLSARTIAGDRVTDLGTSEVTVTEDGRPGRVLQVSNVRRPVNVTVMVDNGFNTESLLLVYRNGLKALFGGLPADVEASLLTLSPAPRWTVRPTRDHGQLMKGIDTLTSDPAAPRTIDGLVEAARRLEQESRKPIEYFPIFVLVSTTGPEGSRPGDRDLQRMAIQMNTSAARVHVIMLSTGGTSPNEVLGAPQVHVAKFLADQTGGRYEAIAASTRIATLLEEYGQVIANAHAFQKDQFLVTAERPAGATGTPGKRTIGLLRQGLTFTVTPDGLAP